MEITPLLPEGYKGEVIIRTCPQCSQDFAIPEEYLRYHTVILCHNCSIIFTNEETFDPTFRILAEWNNKRPKGYHLFYRKQIEIQKKKAWVVFLRKDLGKGHYEVVCDLLLDTSSDTPNTYITFTNFLKPYIV